MLRLTLLGLGLALMEFMSIRSKHGMDLALVLNII